MSPENEQNPFEVEEIASKHKSNNAERKTVENSITPQIDQMPDPTIIETEGLKINMLNRFDFFIISILSSTLGRELAIHPYQANYSNKLTVILAIFCCTTIYIFFRFPQIRGLKFYLCATWINIIICIPLFLEKNLSEDIFFTTLIISLLPIATLNLIYLLYWLISKNFSVIKTIVVNHKNVFFIAVTWIISVPIYVYFLSPHTWQAYYNWNPEELLQPMFIPPATALFFYWFYNRYVK